MSILNHLSENVISGGTKILQAGLEGGNLAVAYGKPALEKSVTDALEISFTTLFSLIIFQT
jgi:hypothetical protein